MCLCSHCDMWYDENYGRWMTEEHFICSDCDQYMLDLVADAEDDRG